MKRLLCGLGGELGVLTGVDDDDDVHLDVRGVSRDHCLLYNLVA